MTDSDNSDNEKPLFYDDDGDSDDGKSWQSCEDSGDDGFIITVDDGDQGEFGSAVGEYEERVTKNIGVLLDRMDTKLYGEAELSDGDEEIKEWADAFPHLRVVGHKMAIHEGIPPELSDQLSELNIEEDLA